VFKEIQVLQETMVRQEQMEMTAPQVLTVPQVRQVLTETTAPQVQTVTMVLTLYGTLPELTTAEQATLLVT
jgi:hypothetical protein